MRSGSSRSMERQRTGGRGVIAIQAWGCLLTGTTLHTSRAQMLLPSPSLRYRVGLDLAREAYQHLTPRARMGFRLKRDGSMPKQLRRIVRSELRTALDELAEDASADAGVYEARKSVKKIRAILRLLRQPLASDYADENARLRRVAHALASIRDADVSLDTLHDLHARYPGAMSARVVRAVGHGLRTRERQARAEVPPLVRRAKAALL